jgi:serine/threonine protein kinase
MPRTISTDQEWAIAKSILEAEKKQGPVASGFKIRFKNHKELQHSFIYLKEDDRETLVTPTRYYNIGAGRNGSVKLCEDEVGQLYAIKAVGKFENHDNEIAVLRKLNYLHLVGNGTRWIYILQTFIGGPTLLQYLPTVTLSDEQKGCIAYQLAKAIQYLHLNGVAYGDSKSNNYIINVTNKEHIIRAIDFGCSLLSSNEGPDAVFEHRRGGDIRGFFNIISTELGFEDKLLKDMSENKDITIDDIVAYLQGYQAIQLPLPNTRKRLAEDYKSLISITISPVIADRKLEHARCILLNDLSYLIKSSNDILEINELFQNIKKLEQDSPVLHSESATKKSWKQVIDWLQERALQIARQQIHLGDPVTNTDAYYYILAENNFSRVKEFETLIFNKNIKSDYNPLTYERAMLAKLLDNYIERINSAKRKDGQTNFENGFLLFKNFRAINRKANFHLAMTLKEQLKDSSKSLSDIFSEANIAILRNQCNPKPRLQGVYSLELRAIIGQSQNQVVKFRQKT